MLRTPKAGETWVWKECEFHSQLRDVVLIGRDFEDQPDFIKRHILGCLYCGCQYASDDAEAAIRELRQWEEQRRIEFREEYLKAVVEAHKPASLWPGVVAAVILVAAALIAQALMERL